MIDKLRALGSPDQIALYFTEQGISGRPAVVNACLISQWFKRETDRSASVTAARVFHGRDTVQLDYVSGRDPVSLFVVAFDRGDYPALIER